MSVRIPHRFFDRLEYAGKPRTLRAIILGTFNPGKPDVTAVQKGHLEELNKIFAGEKYRRFDMVKNFYDRPQNRFWGVLDRLSNSSVYTENGVNFKNPNGLKFYKGADREAVFNRQMQFCLYNGIFISDIVKEIETIDFRKVYNNFSDIVVDRYATMFNTNHLAMIIEHNPDAKLVFNVNESTAIPRISAHIRQLKEVAGPYRIANVLSTSGAAGGHYEELVSSWRKALEI